MVVRTINVRPNRLAPTDPAESYTADWVVGTYVGKVWAFVQGPPFTIIYRFVTQGPLACNDGKTKRVNGESAGRGARVHHGVDHGPSATPRAAAIADAAATAHRHGRSATHISSVQSISESSQTT